MNAPVQTQSFIDPVDRKIIIATQAGLPVCSEPYHEVARTVGIDVSEVMVRMQSMLERGVIRRIAAVPNHYKLGYKANAMTVWDVPDEKVDELGKLIGEQPFVSHCYQRPRHLPDWPYNLFAMVHAHDRDEAMYCIKGLERLLGEYNHGHDALYSTRILKKTGMRLPIPGA